MLSVKQSTKRWSFISSCFISLFVTGMLLASSPALAVVTTMTEYFCADDVSNVGSCTANEVSLSGVTNVSVTDIDDNPLSSCYDGQIIKIGTLDAELDSNTGTRYDVTFWVGRFGNDPRAPSGDDPTACAVTSLPDDTGSLDIANFEDTAGDNCEDFQQPAAPIPVSFGGGNATYVCNDSDNDGMADFQVLTTWQQNVSFLCGVANQTPPLDINDPVFSPGSPSKCDFVTIPTIPVIEVASLTVTKVTTTGTEVFDFTTTGFPEGTVFDGGFSLDTTAPTPGMASLTDPAIPLVDPTNGDTFTITETPVAGWSLVSASCSNGDDPTTGVTLIGGDDVTCTFTNAPDGSVTIIKNTLGGDATFEFTSPTPPIPASINIMTVGGSGSASTVGLGTGVYTVTETPLAGWDLTDLSCEDPNGGTTVDLDTGTVTIDLSAGETITCTYENTNRGSITLLKTTSPSSSDPFEFTHNVVGTVVPASPFTLNAGLAEFFLDVVPGTYLITESDPTPGYDLDNIICLDGVGNVVDSQVDVSARTAIVNVDPGEDVACEFNNFKRGSLTVVKSVSEDGPADNDFDFTSVALGNFSLNSVTAGNDVSTLFANLVAGDYDIAENDPTAAGWELVSATCNDGTDLLDPDAPVPGSVFVDVGQDVTCTFINSSLGSSTIIKNTIGGDDSFDFTGTAQNGETNPMDGLNLVTVGGTAMMDFTNQLSPNGNPFTVTEDPIPANWELTNIVCEDGTGDTTVDIPNATASINVGFGEAVTCTFTNTADASLVVQKSTVPSGLADGFTFTSDGVTTWDTSGVTTTSLTDGTLDSQTGQPGLYTATETVLPGFAITDIVCTGETLSTIQIGTGSPAFETGDDFVEVTLAAGETVTCDFENTKLGSIQIEKQTLGGDGSFLFNSPELGDFQLDTVGNTANTTFSDLLPGDYMIGEIVPQGWDLTDLTCIGETNTVYNYTNPSVTVSLADGENITCTFTNTERGSLTLVKNLPNDNGGNAVATDFTAFIDGNEVAWGVAQEFVPGSYTASESTLPGYQASDWFNACAADGSVTLGPGEDLVCEVTNDDIAPTLTLVKTVVNDNGGLLTQTDFPSFVDGVPQAWDVATELMANVVLTASETPQDGYAPSVWGGDCAADGTITLLPGEAKTCTITNDDVAPTLTLLKTVVNDNGGLLTETDFPSFVNAVPQAWGVATPHGANVVLTASETLQDGYAPSVWGGDCAADGTITLLPGDNGVCTITNDDIAPTLTLLKTVVNDNGGLLTQTDFPSFVNAVPQAWGVATPHAANAVLTASETPQDGYAPSVWGGDCAADGTITLLPGDNGVCTITNDDIAPTLTLVKTVVNDNGGLLTQTDFPSFVNGSPQAWDVVAPQTANVVLTASETPQTGYTPSVWGGDCAADGTITLLPGDAATCTITNDDVAPTLTLVKTVVNDNGGLLTQSDFPSFVNGVPQAWDVTTAFQANVPLVASETPQSGYTPSSWGGDCAADGSITLLPGDVATCTITNDDEGATLTLVKTVVNDNGGLLTETDFPAFIDGVPQAWGVAAPVTTNTLITVTETPQTGYTPSVWGGDCAADGTITLLAGETKICTITNDDVAPTLTLVKTVTNDNGGLLTQSDFPSFVNDVAQAWDVATEHTANAVLTASETPQDGYAPSVWGGDCAADGTITLLPGDVKTCSITNDDIAPTLALVKVVENNNGGTAVETDWTLSADGPTLLSGAGGVPATAVDAGTYILSESTGPDGYSPSAWSCTDGTLTVDSLALPVGATAVCTITNSDLPSVINLAKTAAPAVDLGGGVWEVVYTITASNSGDGPGNYDIMDTMSPGAGITPVIDASYPALVYVGGETRTGELTPAPLANGGTWVTGEGLVSQATETWTVTARFTVDPAQTSPATNTCDPAAPAINTGFYNAVSGSETDVDPTDNETCVSYYPPMVAVPTLSTWAMLLMILLMTVVAGGYFRPMQMRRTS